MNGAGIYDFQKDEMIWFRPISARGEEITRLVLEKIPFGGGFGIHKGFYLSASSAHFCARSNDGGSSAA